MKTNDQKLLLMLVRAREDFQSMRIRMDNRIGRKADGKDQNISDERYFAAEDVAMIAHFADEARTQEESIEKEMKKVLARFPVYNNWMKLQVGVGEVISGKILGKIDIEEATTVSKIWHYTGANPGMVFGKKAVK